MITGKRAGDDRYAVLLRRIEDLETVHADDKKNVRPRFVTTCPSNPLRAPL